MQLAFKPVLFSARSDKKLNVTRSGMALPVGVLNSGVLVVCVLTACTLSACSGSSSPTLGSVDESGGLFTPESLEPPQGTAAVNGLVLIQENNGRRVFDAFFTKQLRNSDFGEPLWGNEDQACYAASESAADMTGRSAVLETTYQAGSSIDIHTRGGLYLSLEPQSLGKIVVYSSDIRWIDTELPQDALLSVSGSEWFPDGVAIELFPLLPIERLEPVNALLPRQSSTVRWVSSESLTDRIQVVFTAPYEHAETADASMVRVNRVYCDVQDSGSFDLPNAVRNALANSDALNVTVSRRRSSEIMHNESVLSVLQISNDQ